MRTKRHFPAKHGPLDDVGRLGYLWVLCVLPCQLTLISVAHLRHFEALSQWYDSQHDNKIRSE